MTQPFNLEKHGIQVKHIVRNGSPALLYEMGLKHEKGTAITSTGALVAMSGAKTGRSPQDKRIVDSSVCRDDVWWGDVNIKLDAHTFQINRERAIDYLNTRPHLFAVDGFAGWDPEHRLKIRVICARAYHALFMQNMLIRPTANELVNFGDPDYVIINAGLFPANRHTTGMTSSTSIALNFEAREFVILGSEYAGEMKKGVFTIMNYLMPKKGVLSMHCSATEALNGADTSILFGLSGTGKTTLSADPKRLMIGDDEHCWSDKGIFNIEGGCYAKVINLTEEAEPDIFHALKFGSVLENVVYNEESRVVDYNNISITENTRGSYPVEYIHNVKLPCTGKHPANVIFLTCDAFGVLPPVAKLSVPQAMYHFMSGYTAKVAGTEMGVTEPKATFSPCFGGPFLVWHPAKYAELLAARLNKHNSNTWLVSTGWSGGGYGVGKRMKLAYTRAIIDSIHSGELAKTAMRKDELFGFEVPLKCTGVPDEILTPKSTWGNGQAYDEAAKKLAHLFRDNFRKYEAGAADEVKKAGPNI